MCQSTVYMVRDGREEEIMRDVIRLVPTEHGLRLDSFFEEPLTVAGRIEQIDFLKHRVMLTPLKGQGE